jgi:hypothetical protein
MAHIPVAHRKGTAREEAENAPGYVGSGTGEHSRRLANGAPFKEDGFTNTYAPIRWRTNGEQIRRVTRELKKVRAKLATPLTRERRAFLQESVQIKLRFLAKLRAERSGTLQ